MGKLGWAIFFITLVVTLAILVVMLVQATGPDDDKKIFRMSIIINDSSDTYWKNFRKGVESAAVDYNLDVNFVTLPEEANSALQKNYITREINNGADAVIISAIDGEELSGWLSDIPIAVPVISIDEYIPNDRVNVTLWADSQAMGAMLAEEIYDAGGNVPYKVILQGSKGYVKKRLAGLEITLKEHGITCTIEDLSEQKSIFSNGIVIALEESVLEQLLENADGSTKIYGIGFTNKILNALDEGHIEGLVIQSDYAKGYLAIKAAYNCLNGVKQPNKIELEFYSVNRQNMYKDPMDKILFPLS